MVKKRVIKLIVCIMLISALMIGFCSAYASADVIAGAALLGGALGSLGVDLLVGGSATAAMLAPWLNSDFSIVGALTGVADGYIKVGDESVIIDGVEYESIFLDPSMAAELHTQAFDFITQKAITSNSSGILATGVGFVNDVPMYQVSGETHYVSQWFTLQFPIPLSTSDFTYGETYSLGTFPTFRTASKKYSSSYWNFGLNNIGSSSVTNMGNYGINTSSANIRVAYNSGYRLISDHGYLLSGVYSFVQDSFDYSYVSGTIDATPLPLNYGFQAFVPSQTLAQAGYSTGTYVIDGGVGTDAVIELIQLLDEIYGQEEFIDAEFVEEVVPPVPPQPIVTPLGEIPYEDFLDTFGQSIYGRLDTIEQSIDTVGLITEGAGIDVVDAVDTVGQSIVDELGNVSDTVDTVGQSIVDELGNVADTVDTVGQSIEDTITESTGVIEQAIEAVGELVDSLVDSIADVLEAVLTHPLDLFDAFLDRLTNIPVIRDLFDGIKRHVGIWHYVVEWISCIAAFLAFFIGLFGDVAYCMVVPIYACVAGAICLAFYKRFGR